MKKVKVMLALGLTLCMLSGQVVWASDVPVPTEDVAGITEETGSAEQTEEPGTADALEEAGEQESGVPMEQAEPADETESAGEVEEQAEKRNIVVDTESIAASTSIVHYGEAFVISFKLKDSKYKFDGNKSQIVLKLNKGLSNELTYYFPISYNSETDTFSGTNSLTGWADVEEGDVSVSSIMLCASDGDIYTINNGTAGEYDHDSNTQDLSGFDFFYVNKAYPFVDIPAGSWYQGMVDIVNYLGIMTGTKPDTFAPTSTLSRAQFATIIYRMEECPKVEYDTTFTDVPKGQFYTEAVIWANKAGIITGYNSKTFGPADVMTREQMATIMYRYAKYCEFDVSGQADLSSFPDNKEVSSFAKEAMSWANHEGIITGDGGKLNPRGNVNRAVCATIISRFIAAYLEH